jgi:hypothetical protein
MAMDNEHNVAATVSNAILFDPVAQSEDIGNGSLTLPHMRLVSFHLCLLGIDMVHPLHFSRMHLLDLKTSITSASLQRKSIVH